MNDKSKIADYFSTIISSIKKLNTNGLSATLISDSVVLKIKYDNINSLRSLIISIAEIQSELALKGIWLRGAISYGDISFKSHEGHQIVHGEALVRAYEIETKYALYPRIVLDPNFLSSVDLDRKELTDALFDKGANLPRPLFDAISEDDGKAFIPSGMVTADALWVDYAHLILIDEDKIITFCKNLKEQMYSGQQHYSKYRWIQNYFWGSFETDYFATLHANNHEYLSKKIRQL